MTSENGVMYMPVAPAYGAGNAGGYNNGMDGIGGIWGLLILLILFGRGGFGFGGGNGNGQPIVINDSGNDVQRGFDQAAVIGGINGVQTAVTTGVSAVQAALCNGFAGVSNGFAQAEIAANGRQMADMQQMFTLQSSLQNCCCNQAANTADLKYTMAMGNRDVIDNDNRNHQAVMDKLCQLEQDGIKQNYENRIAGMQNTIDQLRAANQNATNAAAFNALGDRFQASQDSQTAALEQYLAPVPRPAYVVQNPNCCAQGFGYGGCGNYAA